MMDNAENNEIRAFSQSKLFRAGYYDLTTNNYVTSL